MTVVCLLIFKGCIAKMSAEQDNPLTAKIRKDMTDKGHKFVDVKECKSETCSVWMSCPVANKDLKTDYGTFNLMYRYSAISGDSVLSLISTTATKGTKMYFNGSDNHLFDEDTYICEIRLWNKSGAKIADFSDCD